MWDRYFVSYCFQDRKCLNAPKAVPFREGGKIFKKIGRKILDSQMEGCFFHFDLVKGSMNW